MPKGRKPGRESSRKELHMRRREGEGGRKGRDGGGRRGKWKVEEGERRVELEEEVDGEDGGWN